MQENLEKLFELFKQSQQTAFTITLKSTFFPSEAKVIYTKYSKH